MINVRSLAGIVLIALVCAGFPVAASAEPVYATQVGFFTAPVARGMLAGWELACIADDPSRKGPIVFADGEAYSTHLSGSVSWSWRHGHAGRFVQVDREYVVHEQDRETVAWEEDSSFTRTGTHYAYSEDALGFVIFALWGSTARCRASVEGGERPITYAGGSHAFFVGPEAFRAGVFVQDDHRNVGVGRIFTTSLKGGPALASMAMSDIGEGTLLYDDLRARVPGRALNLAAECRAPNGGVCQHSSLAANELTAAFFAGYDEHGYQGEMVVITLPPGVFAL